MGHVDPAPDTRLNDPRIAQSVVPVPVSGALEHDKTEAAQLLRGAST
jgi:hypothetical protein